MKKIKLIVNSKTSGKYSREMIDGRSHLVTQMMPIRGDTSMNEIFYPDKDLENSFMQLNMLPAPSGHPSVNGVSVLASHPVAINKQNIGGFLRNPRKKGKRVFVDFLIDEQVANKSGDGIEAIRRIENGEKIGVSTGLRINKVINKTGLDDFKKKYTRSGSGFVFDHVAILLNEAAAGAHAGTELITNADDSEVLVFNSEWAENELSTDDLQREISKLISKGVSDRQYSHIKKIMPESQSVVFVVETMDEGSELFKQSYKVGDADVLSLSDDKIEVIENPERFVPKPITKILNADEKANEMKKESVISAIIKNSANSYTSKDEGALNAMDDEKLLAIVAENKVSEEAVKTFLAENSQSSVAGFEQYVENKADFEKFVEEKQKATQAKIDHIAENSEFSVDMLQAKTDQELDIITNMLKTEKVAKQVGSQFNNSAAQSTGENGAQLDYS